ncbi:hypothetical protein BDV12DRAFT_195747 [Aspergillus spectabilis]
MNLRELQLQDVSLQLDFLFSLDSNSEPASDTSLFWPYLENVKVGLVDFLPYVGFDYGSDGWNEDDVPDPGTEELGISQSQWLRESWGISREIPHMEHSYRLYTSLGSAVRQIPRLKSMMVSVGGQLNELKFSTGNAVAWPSIKWETQYGYEPNKRVTSAWGFRLEDVEFKDNGPGERAGYLLL